MTEANAMGSDDAKHQCDSNYLMDGPTAAQRDKLTGITDLDPTKHFCCAWTSVFIGKMQKFFTPNEDIGQSYDNDETQYCGTKFKKGEIHEDGTYTDDSGWPSSVTRSPNSLLNRCCKQITPENSNGQDYEGVCTMMYMPQGHATIDVSDFAREEKLFYKYFVEAWTMATENGLTDKLSCVTSDCSTTRFAKSEEESIECVTDNSRISNAANPICNN
jgi:hypothetical protein